LHVLPPLCDQLLNKCMRATNWGCQHEKGWAMLSCSCGHKNMEPVASTDNVGAHGANVMSVQQMQKSSSDFANGQLSVMGVDRSGPPVTSSTWVRTDVYCWSICGWHWACNMAARGTFSMNDSAIARCAAGGVTKLLSDQQNLDNDHLSTTSR
jgi:hypothetical protein